MRARWLIGLVVMLAVGVGIAALLLEVGAPRWLAFVLGVLVAVSLEPTSYARRGLRRLRERR